MTREQYIGARMLAKAIQIIDRRGVGTYSIMVDKKGDPKILVDLDEVSPEDYNEDRKELVREFSCATFDFLIMKKP